MWISRLVSLVAVGALLIGASGAAFAAEASYDKVFSNRNATGEELADAFFDLLSNTGSPTGTVGTTPGEDEASRALVKPYLDPAFLIQRASGERHTAANYVPADVDDFEIGDVRETRPADDVIVARYSVRTSETLPDAALVMSSDKAPRLTVFHWDNADQRWKVLSHANFNTPIAAICDRDPVLDNQLKSPANPEDQALGENLIRAFQQLVMQGDAAAMLDPMVQVQTASGMGYTTLAERKKPTKHSDWKSERIVVTRNGPLVVISHHNDAKQRMFMGSNQQRPGMEHSLHTLHQTAEGKWKVIAIASFAPATGLPEGVACVPPGPLEDAPL